MTAFATTADVAGTWRTLNAEQTAYAQLLLNAAELWIRGKVPGIDDNSVAAHIVSIEVVRAALQRDAFGGAPSGKQTRGGKTDEWTTARTATVEELARTLVFSDYHLQLLGLWQPSGPSYLMGDRYAMPDMIRLPGANVYNEPPYFP